MKYRGSLKRMEDGRYLVHVTNMTYDSEFFRNFPDNNEVIFCDNFDEVNAYLKTKGLEFKE
jgi:hypothetical protein